MPTPLLVIGGTTASGKSALALRLAEARDAIIVNADSQQLFSHLPTLTARPTPDDEQRADHRLYGILPPDCSPSVGLWLQRGSAVLDEGAKAAGPVILVGGTGLYIKALLEGLPDLPKVPAELRAELWAETAGYSTAELHTRLASLDPLMAARLRPSDRQRILRALEVVLATGQSLAVWQAAPRQGGLPREHYTGIALLPPAAITSPRIEARLHEMLAAGALDEVRALHASRPDLANLPIAKVHGCRELLAVVEGRLELAAAGALIAAQVRQYAKRQRTWFRHQLPYLPHYEVTGDTPGLAEQVLGCWPNARNS